MPFLAQYKEENPEKGKWIPVRETLPMNYPVLAFEPQDEGYDYFIAFLKNGRDWKSADGSVIYPSAWMPLPARSEK